MVSNVFWMANDAKRMFGRYASYNILIHRMLLLFFIHAIISDMHIFIYMFLYIDIWSTVVNPSSPIDSIMSALQLVESSQYLWTYSSWAGRWYNPTCYRGVFQFWNFAIPTTPRIVSNWVFTSGEFVTLMNSPVNGNSNSEIKCTLDFPGEEAEGIHSNWI